MVAVLVREDVRLRQGAAGGAELRLKLVEETEVDIDVVVVRAVERADGRRCCAAAGLDRPVEEPRARRRVVAQRLRPVRLHAVDDADDAAILSLVGVGPRAALLLELRRRRPRPDRLAREEPRSLDRRRRRARGRGDHEKPISPPPPPIAIGAPPGPRPPPGRGSPRPVRIEPRVLAEPHSRLSISRPAGPWPLLCAWPFRPRTRPRGVGIHQQVAGRVANACRAVAVELVLGLAH